MERESLETFTKDPDVHDLIYFRLLCISEAARNLLLLEPTIVERYSEIPWKRVRDLGNVLRHEYGEIDNAAIWKTIVDGDLRFLLDVARRAVTQFDV